MGMLTLGMMPTLRVCLLRTNRPNAPPETEQLLVAGDLFPLPARSDLRWNVLQVPNVLLLPLFPLQPLRKTQPLDRRVRKLPTPQQCTAWATLCTTLSEMGPWVMLSRSLWAAKCGQLCTELTMKLPVLRPATRRTARTVHTPLAMSDDPVIMWLVRTPTAQFLLLSRVTVVAELAPMKPNVLVLVVFPPVASPTLAKLPQLVMNLLIMVPSELLLQMIPAMVEVVSPVVSAERYLVTLGTTAGPVPPFLRRRPAFPMMQGTLEAAPAPLAVALAMMQVIRMAPLISGRPMALLVVTSRLQLVLPNPMAQLLGIAGRVSALALALTARRPDLRLEIMSLSAVFGLVRLPEHVLYLVMSMPPHLESPTVKPDSPSEWVPMVRLSRTMMLVIQLVLEVATVQLDPSARLAFLELAQDRLKSRIPAGPGPMLCLKKQTWTLPIVASCGNLVPS